MDIFTRFNRKNILDRQIDTLIGLSKGLVADGKVNQAEAEFLSSWLIQSKQADVNPLIVNLLNKIREMLKDDFLDEEESLELLQILHTIAGENSEIGELAKTTSLPINNPLPRIAVKDMSFLFTGLCVFGTRKQCQQEIDLRGGINAKSVTKSLNYLVLGTYVTDSWAHENFGRKIERAMEYRDDGTPLAIITEEHWADEIDLSL